MYHLYLLIISTMDFVIIVFFLSSFTYFLLTKSSFFISRSFSSLEFLLRVIIRFFLSTYMSKYLFLFDYTFFTYCLIHFQVLLILMLMVLILFLLAINLTFFSSESFTFRYFFYCLYFTFRFSRL